jgi:hypothetical protein
MYLRYARRKKVPFSESAPRFGIPAAIAPRDVDREIQQLTRLD